MSIIKEEAKKLIDKLQDQATWDDIMYEFYVKKDNCCFKGCRERSCCPS